jgi:hypothetical protein
VGHDLLEGPLPLAGGAGARTRVRPEGTLLLVLKFLVAHECEVAAAARVFACEFESVGHLLHGQVADVAKGTSARWAAAQLGPAAGAHEVSALALQDGWEHVVKADGTLQEAGQVGRILRGGHSVFLMGSAVVMVVV